MPRTLLSFPASEYMLQFEATNRRHIVFSEHRFDGDDEIG